MAGRPPAVVLLVLLVVLQAATYLWHALQFLGLAPFTIGGIGFFGQSTVGAIVAGLDVVVCVIVAAGLWNLRGWAWYFLVLVSLVSLGFSALAVLGAAELVTMLPSMAVDALLLVYCFWPGTREAFGLRGGTARPA